MHLLKSSSFLILFSFLLVGCSSNKEILNGPSKIEEKVFNVQDFGAIGDGIVDDTKPIQRAIDGARLKTSTILYFPEGTYLVSRTLKNACISLYSGMTIKGDGIDKSIIKLKKNQDSHTRIVSLDNVKNVRIDSISFNGNAYEKNDFENKIESQFNKIIIKEKNRSNEHLHSVFIKNSRNIQIRNCSFYNSRGDGIYVTGLYNNQERAEDIIISNCRFLSSKRNCLTLAHGYKNILIENNSFYGEHVFSSLIDSEPQQNKIKQSYTCEKLIIRNNKFIVPKGKWKRLDIAGRVITKNILIDSNYFKNVEVHLVNTEALVFSNNKMFQNYQNDSESILIRYFNNNLQFFNNTIDIEGKSSAIKIQGYTKNSKNADPTIPHAIPQDIEFYQNSINTNSSSYAIKLETVNQFFLEKNKITGFDLKEESKCIYLDAKAGKTNIRDFFFSENTVKGFEYFLHLNSRKDRKIFCVVLNKNTLKDVIPSFNVKPCKQLQNKEKCPDNCIMDKREF